MSETTLIQQEQNLAATIPAGTALNVWQDKDAFEQTARVASMLSKSSIVPQSYQGKPEDCFIAVELASRMNTSPLFIMQNLYVVKGKPSWAGQACMAMILGCGKFRDVKHVYTGEKGTNSRGCYVTAVRIADGETVNGTEVTMQMAASEGWTSNSKWKNMPEQMLGYRAASFFARMYCPEAMMGLQTTEEVYDTSGTSPRNQRRDEAPDVPAPVCEECGKEIEGLKNFSPHQIAETNKKRYGQCLCVECGKKRKAELEAEKTSQEQGHKDAKKAADDAVMAALQEE